MSSLAGPLVAALLAFAPQARRGPPRPHRPAAESESQPTAFWHWMEDSSDVVYPLLGIAVIGLIFLAIRRGMVGHDAEVMAKGRQKDSIVRLMRARLSLTADAVAAELKVDRFRAAVLLDELEREGKLVQQRMTGGVATYRLKGL